MIASSSSRVISLIVKVYVYAVIVIIMDVGCRVRRLQLCRRLDRFAFRIVSANMHPVAKHAIATIGAGGSLNHRLGSAV